MIPPIAIRNNFLNANEDLKEMTTTARNEKINPKGWEIVPNPKKKPEKKYFWKSVKSV
jgi:hypothetical protein